MPHKEVNKGVDIDMAEVCNKGFRFTIADDQDIMGTKRSKDGRITTDVASLPIKHGDPRESER